MRKSISSTTYRTLLFIGLLALFPMMASATVTCINTSVSGVFSGNGEGGIYGDNGDNGPTHVALRYAFTPNASNTTTGAVIVSGVMLDGSITKGVISSMGGTYSVVAGTCSINIAYDLYHNGKFLVPMRTTLYMNQLTSPAAPAPSIPNFLTGVEKADLAGSVYHMQWTIDLNRLTR